MSRHLRLVGDEPPKRKRRKGDLRHESTVLTADEQKRARQALRNLRDAFGTWACLAEAMGLPTKTLFGAVHGRVRLSPAIVLRAMRAVSRSMRCSAGPCPRTAAGRAAK